MYVLEWRSVSAPTRGFLLGLFSELQSNDGNKHQNNTPVSAETVHHKSTYVTLFLSWHNESINDDKIIIFTHRSRVSPARFSFCWWSIAHDVTMTKKLWHYQVNNDIELVRYRFYLQWYSWAWRVRKHFIFAIKPFQNDVARQQYFPDNHIYTFLHTHWWWFSDFDLMINKW